MTLEAGVGGAEAAVARGVVGGGGAKGGTDVWAQPDVGVEGVHIQRDEIEFIDVFPLVEAGGDKVCIAVIAPRFAKLNFVHGTDFF